MSDKIDNERFRKLLLSFPEKALNFLYDQYYHRLLSISSALTSDRKAAEDIVQEAFVVIWQNAKKLAQYHPRSIEHYLVKVVKYKSITYYRENHVLSARRNDFLSNHAVSPNLSIESQIIRDEINKEIRQLINTFPRRERECLLMKLDEELSTKQIAAKLNVSEKAVERSLTSAKKRFKERWIALNKKS